MYADIPRILPSADICYVGSGMKNGTTNAKGESWEPVIYLDKLCGLVAAAGIGYLLARYVPIGATIVWVIVGVALAVKIVLHVL